MLPKIHILFFLIFIFDIHVIECKSKESWNALIFSQQWPITSCIDHMARKPNASCNLFRNMTSWGVHGLWPTDSGKIGPNFCNNTWRFEEDKIKDIELYLLKYWPNIFGETSTTSFWEHEWMKHGTCAAEITQFNSEHKYFLSGIEFVTKYDMVSILGTKKIYPSDETSYNVDDIISAIKFSVKSTPVVDCTYNSKLKRHELSQIKICFTRQLQLIDCDKIQMVNLVDSYGNCPQNEVYYPSSVKIKDRTYHYSTKLAVLHTAAWLEANSCSSWLCKTFKMVRALSLLTF